MVSSRPGRDPRAVSEPAAPQRGRRWWLAGAAAAVVLVGLGWLLMRWWSAEPWEELERVAATFPAPDGFEVVDESRIGDRPAVCQVKPSCDDPRVRVEYRLAEGSEDVCDAVEASAGAWEPAGFTIRQTRGGNAETPCIVDGEIDGHTVQMLALSADGGGPGLAVVIWD